MREDSDRQEVIAIPVESESVCAECNEHANSILQARADVIRFAGHIAMSMLPLLIVLSFADSVINHYSWQGCSIPAIATGCVTALGGIMLWAFNTRKGDK